MINLYLDETQRKNLVFTEIDERINNPLCQKGYLFVVSWNPLEYSSEYVHTYFVNHDLIARKLAEQNGIK